MNRADYLDQRRAIRSAAATRADRGLSKHPDGSGLHVCPRCMGAGLIDSDHVNPECVTSASCFLCEGSGYIADGYRDPLLRLRYARQPHVRRRDPSQYVHLFKLCTYPCWRLRLIESCVGAEIEARKLVSTWRSAVEMQVAA